MKKRTKKTFLEIHSQPQFISGIHNYCDRWCERCPKTQYCSVFATEQFFEIKSGSEDLKNSMAVLENMFAVTMELLQDLFQKHNIDLTSVDPSAIKDETKAARKFLKNHPLTTFGQDYFKISHEILKQNADYLEAKVEETISIFAATKQEELLSLQDHFEVIRWYCMLLPAKLSRCAANLNSDEDPDDEWTKTEFYGTFKIAFVAAKRSLIAWAKVLDSFPEKEDLILPALVLLERIIQQILIFCPEIAIYKRNGLDD